MRNYGIDDQNPNPQDIIGGGEQPSDGPSPGSPVGGLILLVVVLVVLIVAVRSCMTREDNGQSEQSRPQPQATHFASVESGIN